MRAVGWVAAVHIYKLGVDIGFPQPVEGRIVGAEVGVHGHVGVNELNALRRKVGVHAEVSECVPGELRIDLTVGAVGCKDELLTEDMLFVKVGAIGAECLGKINGDPLTLAVIRHENGITGKVLAGIVDSVFCTLIHHGGDKSALLLIKRTVGEGVFRLNGLG